uniref:Uncharacterized protein n=1 Tax=Cyprinus carpio TaxID=7962 RepID=A0A8C1VAW2_CYPCA
MFSDVILPKETLLSAPGAEEPVFDRHQSSISGCSERFRLGESSFSRQTHEDERHPHHIQKHGAAALHLEGDQ